MADAVDPNSKKTLDEGVQSPLTSQETSALQRQQVDGLSLEKDKVSCSQAKFIYKPASTQYRTYDEAMDAFSHMRSSRHTKKDIYSIRAKAGWDGDLFIYSFNEEMWIKWVKAEAKSMEKVIAVDREYKKDEARRGAIKEVNMETQKLWSQLRQRTREMLARLPH